MEHAARIADDRPESRRLEAAASAAGRSATASRTAALQAMVDRSRHTGDGRGSSPALGAAAPGGPPAPRRPEHPVQRLVASASEGREDDRIFQNTTLTAHTLVGGKIKRLSETDFSSDFASKTENLAITAHGKVNVVGDYKAPELAARLTDEDKGFQEGSHDVLLQSCYAAVEERENPESEPTSVLSTLKDALTRRAEAQGWDRVPEVSGSYGPQIVTRVPKEDDSGEYRVDKAVVDPRLVPVAARLQDVMRAEVADVKEKVVLAFGREGQDFVEQAEKDEPVVRSFKEIFIHLVSGNPKGVDGNVLGRLRARWLEKGYPEKLAAAIFDRGVDLRASEETTTL